jgi:hypothetical protein
MDAADGFLRLLTPTVLVLNTIKGQTSTSSFSFQVALQETSTVSKDHHHKFEC